MSVDFSTSTFLIWHLRPCIRSSLNVYLTILSFADILFMVLIYVSSKQYHEDVHHSTYEVYWRMFGLSHWFYTAFSKCLLLTFWVFSLHMELLLFLLTMSMQCTLHFIWRWVWLQIDMMLWAIPLGRDVASYEQKTSSRVSYLFKLSYGTSSFLFLY